MIREGSCDYPLKDGFCTRGSHHPADLRRTWAQLFAQLAQSPFSDSSVVSALPARFLPPPQPVTSLPPSSARAVHFPDADEGGQEEEDDLGEDFKSSDFDLVLGSQSDSIAKRILATEFAGLEGQPLMSVHGAVIATDGKQRPLGAVLLDTQCQPHSVMPRHIFDALEDNFVDTYEPSTDSAVLADFSTAVKISAYVRLPVCLTKDGLDYQATVRFALIDSPSGQVLLSLHDCLLKFPTLFRALADEAKLSLEKDLGRLDPHVAGLRPAEWPPPSDLPDGTLLEKPWTLEAEPTAQEELDTPMTSSFSGPLEYLTKPWDEVHADYLAMFEAHVSPEMRSEVPELIAFLRSDECLEVFLPRTWSGLKKFPPVELEFLPSMPTVIRAPPRNMEAAKAEFERLKKYFYVESTSTVVSPLTVAPKATAPFIRFCIDLRVVNQYLKIPQRHIPHVQHELEKAARFRVYMDLDMTNSFHQILLGLTTSNNLSVKTPWGNYRPRFLPEGVGPASGILQEFVTKIFAGFEEWTIIIFDNFLILAHDLRDAFEKFKLVIERCREHGVVLKFAKSWLGFREVSFFGYQLKGGQYGMSADRKAAIAALPFPSTRSGMQRCLGMGLFFKPFVPNYSDLAAPLNSMVHKNFSWDSSTWTVDYAAAFEKYKDALQRSLELSFPDYEAEWTVRADSSQVACGAVLLQRVPDPAAPDKWLFQVIQLASAKFSDTAMRWDIHKKEMYALYFAFKCFQYYLIGKSVILETDHRNLLGMELSESAIVIRWRMFLQNFVFILRHIAGTDNVIADYLSRMHETATLPLPPAHRSQLLCFIAAVHGGRGKGKGPSAKSVSSTEVLVEVPAGPPRDELFPHDPDYYLSRVHGGRRGHLGVRATHERLGVEFPGNRIPIAYISDFIARCAGCQKMRLDMVSGIKSLPRNLGVRHSRCKIGVDRVTVSPPDKFGNCNVVSIVEFFTGFFQGYPTKDYTATSLATCLFKFYCDYGTFEEIASDPGSDLMSEAVRLLHEWLGIRHVVSIVDRHESNGVERHNKEVLRHLRALVFDERLKDSWGDPVTMSLINFMINDTRSAETGVRPFEAKFGSFDSAYFRLPDHLRPEQADSKFLKELDRNLATVRKIVKETKRRVVLARLGSATEATQNQYQPGDFVLFLNDAPHHLRPEKLAPRWSGPYKVVTQTHNDVHASHAATHRAETLHVDRCKPWFGTAEDAFQAALRDQDQYTVVRILAWRGDPAKRKTLQFLVLYEDGDMTWNHFCDDVTSTTAFEAFCSARPILRGLLLAQHVELARNKQIRKTPIDQLEFYFRRPRSATSSTALSSSRVSQFSSICAHGRILLSRGTTRWTCPTRT
jgi:RNase H-like domain found in reverse transcriptase